jgi:hypothetical protein
MHMSNMLLRRQNKFRFSFHVGFSFDMCTCFQGCDADIASFLLEANQWNVEAAVNQVALFPFYLRALASE